MCPEGFQGRGFVLSDGFFRGRIDAEGDGYARCLLQDGALFGTTDRAPDGA